MDFVKDVMMTISLKPRTNPLKVLKIRKEAVELISAHSDAINDCPAIPSKEQRLNMKNLSGRVILARNRFESYAGITLESVL